MTTKHTEGPWLMCESATHVTVTNAHGDAVFHDDKRIPGVMADARLIAAAPDLLDELLSVLYWAVTEQSPLRNQEIENICKVIAKATGEQP